MFLENKYFKFAGLNLTLETLEGLLKHNGPVDDLSMINKLIGLKVFKNKINYNTYPSLEAQISAISDDIAYNNHDIQDGLKAKMFKLKDLMEINFFKDISNNYKKKSKSLDKDILIYQIIRDSINLMVKDLINNTIYRIKHYKIKTINDVFNSSSNLVTFSNKFVNIEKEIKFFLKLKMYKNKNVMLKNKKGEKIIKILFDKISKKPSKFINKEFIKIDKYRAISDYISGMTDRYAINLYKKLK